MLSEQVLRTHLQELARLAELNHREGNVGQAQAYMAYIQEICDEFGLDTKFLSTAVTIDDRQHSVVVGRENAVPSSPTVIHVDVGQVSVVVTGPGLEQDSPRQGSKELHKEVAASSW